MPEPYEPMTADESNAPETPDGGGMDAPPLDPKTVRLFYDPRGYLRATIGDRTWLDVSVVRAFPLSEEDRYIGLLSGRIDEIGIIVDPAELDAESRGIVARELARRYFRVRIMSVNSIREEFGATYWDVETDRGNRKFVGKGIRDNVAYLPDGRVLIQDVDGNRYEIPGIANLDDRSRSLVLRVI